MDRVGTTCAQIIPPNPYRKTISPIILEPGCYCIFVDKDLNQRTIKNNGPHRIFLDPFVEMIRTDSGEATVSVIEQKHE